MNTTLTTVQEAMRMEALLSSIFASEGTARFASFTYRAKGTGELSRYNLSLGFDYGNLLKKSLVQLQKIKASAIARQTKIAIEICEKAKQELIESMEKSIACFEAGISNDSYTKAEYYISVSPNVKINRNDGTLHIFGLLNSKVVLEKGEYKTVNSRPLTLAKKAIEKFLVRSKFREFCLSNVNSARINGQTLEFV